MLLPQFLLSWNNSVFQCLPEEPGIDANELLARKCQLLIGQLTILVATLDLLGALAHHTDLAIHSADGGIGGRLEISNNRAERSIKPFVIDRKNFLFANTPKGATGSAIMFSLIQTAIENGLDPYKYLTWLLKTTKDADLTDVQVVKKLLPWNAPQECKTK
mgnify:CR=1 FL=1